MEFQELDHLMEALYLEGSPAQALQALSALVSRPDFAETPVQQLIPLVIFFQLVARRHPEVLAGYRELLAAAQTRQSRGFLELVQSPLETEPFAPVSEPSDLDRLWLEFAVTGEAAPVQRILEVLAWPDRLRAHLEGLLASRGPLDLQGRDQRRQLLQGIASLGISADATGEHLQTIQDLDCLALMRGVRMATEQVKVLQQALPQPLGAEDLVPMACKATAKWSLCCHAQSHARVRELCEQALPLATGSLRLTLLEVLVHAHQAAGDHGAAIAAASEYLAQVPDQEDIAAVLHQARTEQAITRRLALFGLGEGRERSALEGPALLEQCQQATQGQPTYRLLRQVKDLHRPGFADRGGLASELSLDVVRPEHYWGHSWFWDEQEQAALADEWISRGTEHYENPTFWVQVPNPARAQVHQGAAPEAFLVPLASLRTEQVRAHQHQDSAYVELRYRGATLSALRQSLGLGEVLCDVDLILEEGSGLLAAVRVRVRRQGQEGADLAIRQVFFGYGELLQICAPQVLASVPEGTDPQKR